MNEIIKSILNRRSIRAFSNQEIDKKTVQTLLDCALAAPSGMNQQTWQFTAIMNQEKILAFAKAVGKALGRDEGYNMYCPKVLIITSNDKESRFKEVDNTIDNCGLTTTGSSGNQHPATSFECIFLFVCKIHYFLFSFLN